MSPKYLGGSCAGTNADLRHVTKAYGGKERFKQVGVAISGIAVSKAGIRLFDVGKSEVGQPSRSRGVVNVVNFGKIQTVGPVL